MSAVPRKPTLGSSALFVAMGQFRTHALQQIREDLTAETIANVSKRASRLYEQECGAVAAAAALEIYVKRWLRWAEERDEAGCRSHGKR